MKKAVYLIFLLLYVSCNKEDNVLKNVNNSILTKNFCDSIFLPEKAEFPNNIVNVSNFVSVEEAMDFAINTNSDVTIYFPSGLYLINNGLNSASLKPLKIHNYPHNVEIIGDGDCSLLKLNVGNPNCANRLVDINNSGFDVYIKNIALECAVLCDSKGKEQANNIRIRNANNIEISNIYSYNANGDNLNVGCSENIVVKDSNFGASHRNGITFGGNGNSTNPCIVNNIEVLNSYFDGGIKKQQIDFEHGDNYKNINIFGNRFQQQINIETTKGCLALSLAAIGKPDEGKSNQVKNNHFGRNAITMINTEDVVFTNNISIGRTQILNGSKDVDFNNNSFNIIPTYRTRLIGGIHNSGIFLRTVYNSNIYPVINPVRNISFSRNNITLNDEGNHQFPINRSIYIDNLNNIEFTSNDITNNQVNSFSSMKLRVNHINMSVDLGNYNTFINGSGDQVEFQEQSGYSINCLGSNCND